MCWIFDWMMSIPVGGGWNLWEAVVILVGCCLIALVFLLMRDNRKR